jgi:hypothetical protein
LARIAYPYLILQIIFHAFKGKFYSTWRLLHFLYNVLNILNNDKLHTSFKVCMAIKQYLLACGKLHLYLLLQTSSCMYKPGF